MAESVQIASVSNRHEAIADMMLANPTMAKGEIARRMGVSPSWLSIVIHSDVFIEYFDARRKLFNDQMQQQLATATLDLALTSIKKLKEDVLTSDKPEFKLAVSEHMMKYNGYEPRAKMRVTETKTIEHSSPIDQNTLADARARMVRRQSVTIEQEVPVAT